MRKFVLICSKNALKLIRYAQEHTKENVWPRLRYVLNGRTYVWDIINRYVKNLDKLMKITKRKSVLFMI